MLLSGFYSGDPSPVVSCEIIRRKTQESPDNDEEVERKVLDFRLALKAYAAMSVAHNRVTPCFGFLVYYFVARILSK